MAMGRLDQKSLPPFGVAKEGDMEENAEEASHRLGKRNERKQ